MLQINTLNKKANSNIYIWIFGLSFFTIVVLFGLGQLNISQGYTTNDFNLNNIQVKDDIITLEQEGIVFSNPKFSDLPSNVQLRTGVGVTSPSSNSKLTYSHTSNFQTKFCDELDYDFKESIQSTSDSCNTLQFNGGWYVLSSNSCGFDYVTSLTCLGDFYTLGTLTQKEPSQLNEPINYFTLDIDETLNSQDISYQLQTSKGNYEFNSDNTLQLELDEGDSYSLLITLSSNNDETSPQLLNSFTLNGAYIEDLETKTSKELSIESSQTSQSLESFSVQNTIEDFSAGLNPIKALSNMLWTIGSGFELLFHFIFNF